MCASVASNANNNNNDNNQRQAKSFAQLVNDKRNQILQTLNAVNYSLFDFGKYINKHHKQTSTAILKLCNEISKLTKNDLNDDDEFSYIDGNLCQFTCYLTLNNNEEVKGVADRWTQMLNGLQYSAIFNTIYINPYYEMSKFEVFELIYRYIIINICKIIQDLNGVDFSFDEDRFKRLITHNKLTRPIVEGILSERPDEINLINLHCLDFLVCINRPGYDIDLFNYLEKLDLAHELRDDYNPWGPYLIYNNELYILIKFIINYYQNKYMF